jgi:hypothetical protein
VKAVSTGPELWAADGAPRAAIPHPKVLNVELPIPKAARTEDDRYYVRNCADQIDFALLKSTVEIAAMALPDDVRTCLAARLYKHCADGTQKEYDKKYAGRGFDRRAQDRIAMTRQTAREFERQACTGVASSRETDAIFSEVSQWWDRLQEPPKHGDDD